MQRLSAYFATCARSQRPTLGHHDARVRALSRMEAAVDRQSGPRPEIRFLRQPVLEGLTNSARTETPRRGDRNKSDHGAADDGGRRWRVGTSGGGVRLWRGGGGRTLRSRVRLVVGPQPLRLRNHNFGLAHRIMVKRLATSPHDPLGITDSACKNQLVVVSVQYGPFNTYIPIRSTTIGKSRVARDPTAMHTSWRSNSDIASVTRASMTFRVVRTNQYNQDLELIHSTNGNHLESPNEGSSIDHQVTIHLHAQNITMFPTNETWYFASQMLVSMSGGLILILTAQSTRNDSECTREEDATSFELVATSRIDVAAGSSRGVVFYVVLVLRVDVQLLAVGTVDFRRRRLV
ncbi:ABC transporter C family member 13 [Dorcoceras hygrometricum]|uniref:ABC transporter C family member 13 n=1 Tax=Dorcoceras hygrometricum TaxID=472368 RepID=A0A2Z7APN7_9LAMI|nr:ABC transporter C family member 13 [Dorcoceras hygrometricum]